MKKILLISILLLGTLNLVAQKHFYLVKNHAAWEGKWIAAQGDKAYELSLRYDTVYYAEYNAYAAFVSGSIIYKQNGVVTRTTPIDQRNAFISLPQEDSDKMLSGQFADSTRKIAGSLILRLNDAKNRLSWELQHGVVISRQKGWTTEKNFDIPLQLEFVKVP